MDSNEEFDFKPLTEGLGFHTKKVDLAQEIKKSKLFSEMITDKSTREVPSLPVIALEESPLEIEKPISIKPPLPRVEHSEALNKTPKGPQKDVIDELIESFKKPAKNFIEDKKANVVFEKIPNEEKQNGVRTAWALAPFLVDAMMVIAFFLIGLIIALYVTQVDIIDFVINSSSQVEHVFVIPSILFGMIYTYMVLTRMFLGGTLGEMVFDMQLGSAKDHESPFYGLRVLVRLMLATLTGFIPLPFFSWIFRRDFLGKCMKLHLIKKK
jgi:hypothetical protein